MEFITHGEYSIEVVEIDAEPKMCEAHIRRLDGAKIKVVADGSIHLTVRQPASPRMIPEASELAGTRGTIAMTAPTKLARHQPRSRPFAAAKIPLSPRSRCKRRLLALHLLISLQHACKTGIQSAGDLRPSLET